MNELTGQRLRLVTWLVTGAMFMEVLDGNIIATALPQMGQSFGVAAVKLNVAMSAYMLALGVFIPVSGWMSSRFGARSVFSTAIVSFTAASIGCGLAGSLQSFVLLRILQGASGALMVPVGRLLVLSHTPKSQRMQAMSSLVWPALIAPVIAPPLGGLIVGHFSWHWVFFLNVPLGLLAFGLAQGLVPRMELPPRQQFDWTGFLLSGMGVFALLGGLEQLAASVSWLHAAILMAGLLLLLAAVRHFRRSPHPMLDLRPMQIQTFRVAMLGGSLSRMAIGSLPFLLPLMLQLGFGLSAVHAGLLLLVVFAGNLGMKSVTTPILRRFGYRRVLLVNGVLAAASLALCALITPAMPTPLLWLILLVNGMTRSMQFSSMGTLAFADVPEERMGDANGLFNVNSQISMAAGITFAALILRLGHGLGTRWQISMSAFDYRFAFVFSALVAALSLVDAWRLPTGAGDHFVARKRG
ncbi:MFS transporter [Frateuria aurantia]